MNPLAALMRLQLRVLRLAHAVEALAADLPKRERIMRAQQAARLMRDAVADKSTDA